MSGVDIPYHLRPNKFVDRQIFFDLLQKLDQAGIHSDRVYVSMGGKFLEDHRVLRFSLDLQSSVSIERAEHLIDRQEFNKPFADVQCLHQTTSDFVKGFSTFRASYGADTSFVVWLDYAASNERLAQLEELSRLVSFGRPNDVFRITVNANPETLKGSNAKLPEQFRTIQEWRLSIFESQLGKFPANAKVAEMSAARFPKALARAIGTAAQKGAKGKKLTPRPLSVTAYNDDQHQMLSVTIALFEEGKADENLQKPEISVWPFLAKDWDDVHMIKVPDLSLKEKLLLDRHIHTDSDNDIANLLSFKLGEGQTDTLSTIAQYREHRRFYPQFIRMA